MKGFWTIIQCRAHEEVSKDNVMLARAPNSNSGMDSFDFEQLGTRHRSMMKYYYNHPKSIGFVVSQDGDVRAMKRVGINLLVWEKVKILKVW